MNGGRTVRCETPASPNRSTGSALHADLNPRGVHAAGFAAVVFASTGEVARDPGALRLNALRLAGGAGVRFRLTPEGTNLRLDVAESAAGPEVCLLLLEAR